MHATLHDLAFLASRVRGDAPARVPRGDEGQPSAVQSFRLAPAGSGAKSFRLSPWFSNRQPRIPEPTARQAPGVRSFCLAPATSNVRSFRLALGVAVPACDPEEV